MIKKRPRGNLSPNSGAKARAKGHRYERQLRKEFIELGFTECQTSRFASKMLDDAKVDLWGTDPLYIQAKNIERNFDPQAILESMPKTKTHHNIVIRKKKKFKDVVCMDKSTFYEFLEMLKKNLIL
jgi:hypothetical protein